MEGLECLVDQDRGCHTDCPYYTCRSTNCFREMARDALELITVQQEKIQELDSHINKIVAALELLRIAGGK